MNKKIQLQFAYRCASLIESGISLSESISIIIRMEKSLKIKKTLLLIRERLEKGVSLSKSMSLTGNKFDQTLLTMISYGENSGILALSLRQAGEIMEKRNNLLKKMAGVLMYPFIIALATAGMTLFLVMYIFPKIIPLLSSMNVTLPLITRVIRRLYELLSSYGLWSSVIFILGLSIFFYCYKKKNNFRYKMQIFLLILPFSGEVLKKYIICSYSRTVGTLLECGQLLPDILEQMSLSGSFDPYSKAWRISRSEVIKGVPLSECLRGFKTLFPSIVPDMLAIGERTGSSSFMWKQIGKMYEQELDDFINALSTTIEPVLMVIMGLIVGSVALSIILPIYEITNQLNH